MPSPLTLAPSPMPKPSSSAYPLQRGVRVGGFPQTHAHQAASYCCCCCCPSLRYHTVSDEDNDYNFVHLALPGGGGSRADMFWQLDTLRKWRREMVRWPHCATSLTMRERGPNSLPLPTHAPRACHHASQTCGASLSRCTCLEMTRRNRSFCREPTLALQACHCPRTKQPQRSSS